jgi:aspartate/methionine/tyrosine aminotransferase
MLPSFFWRKFFVRTGMAGWLPSIKRLLGGGEHYLRYLGDRALAAPVDELLDPAWFPDVQVPDAINLALGAPRCELALGALRSVNDRRALSAWGLAELREEIAGRRPQEQVAPFDPADEVLITHGASGAFAAAIDTFLNPGSNVVLFDPTSPLFILGLKHRRARIRWVQTWLENGKTRFDIESFAASMRGARLLVLADPVNPTGGVFAPEELEQIAWWAKKHDVLIYTDESFGNFRYESEETRLAALPNAENRLLIAGSVSKSHGLNAARVGWLLGCRHLLRPCAAMASMAAPFVSPLCQQLALAALRSGEETAAKIRDEFAGRRRYLVESLQGMGLPPAYPAGAYFCWMPVSRWGLTGREFARQLLLSQRVLVNAGEPFGPSGEDFIRLSYATEEGRLREGLQRLATFMDELRKLNAATPPQLNWTRPTGGTVMDEHVEQSPFGTET